MKYIFIIVSVCTSADLDLQNTATAHHSSQPMDTLTHARQQNTQHQTAASLPAAAASKVCAASVCCFRFITTRCYASAVYAVALCLCLNLGSNKQHHWITQGLYFSDAKNLREIRPG